MDEDFQRFLQQIAQHDESSSGVRTLMNDRSSKGNEKSRVFFILAKLLANAVETLDLQDLLTLMIFIDRESVKELSKVQSFIFRTIKSVKSSLSNLNQLRAYVGKTLQASRGRMTELSEDYLKFEGDCINLIGDQISQNNEIQELIKSYLDKHDPPEWVVWLNRVTELFATASHTVMRHPLVRDTLLNMIFKAVGVNQMVRMSTSDNQVRIEELPDELFTNMRLGTANSSEVVIRK